MDKIYSCRLRPIYNPLKIVDLQIVDPDFVLDGIAGKSKISLLFMDLCRDNPFTKKLVVGSRSISRSGLASIDSAAGTLIAFSTAPGRVAEDGNSDHSPFTKALLNNIEQPGVEVRRMMSNVRREVREGDWRPANAMGELGS